MRKRRRHSLHEYVVRELGHGILLGKYPVGSPLPPDAALCERLHVSRTALREALIVLAAKGLIEARQKVGTVVRPRDEWNMLDADILNWGVSFDNADELIAELYELRRLIEPLAASLAAERATKSQVEKIRAAYADMAKAGDDGAKVLEPDVRFHRGLIAATGNSLFASVGHIVASALEVNFGAIKDSPRGHAWALPLHKAILDAVASRDSKAARVAMQKLLTASEQDMRRLRAQAARRLSTRGRAKRAAK